MENVHQNPIVFKIQNGTMRSDVDLCGNCRWAHRMRHANSGDAVTFCNAIHGGLKIRGQIAQCSSHNDRTKPTLSDMQEIAWQLQTDKGGRTLGFHSPEQLRERRNGADTPAPPTRVGF